MKEDKKSVGKPKIDLKERIDSLEDEFYSIDELAKILKVHERTIRNHIKNGEIKAKKYGNQWRIKKSDFL